MIITIDLPEEVETKVKTHASADGLPVEDYLGSLVAEATYRRDVIRSSSEKSFAEILAPIQHGFQKSEMDDDEILNFFEDVREELWQERQRGK